MALINTINFLPQIFQSSTNQRFLGATLDQLTTGAVNKPVNGYIGRTFAPTYKNNDNYVPEPTNLRKQYQLEPGVVVKESDQIVFNANYVDLLQSITNYGGLSNNHQRLFVSDSYNYDGRFDYNKFVNYNNYYWLPSGPPSVYVTSNQTPYNVDYEVTRNTANGGYTFTGLGGQPNSQLTLARGGSYTFKINQPGFKFWIQSMPGINGTDPNIVTHSTREVFGAYNNGIDSGTITLNVPQETAQDFYLDLPTAATVDAAVTLDYNQIQGRVLSEFLDEFPDGIDDIRGQLQNKSLIFINNNVDATSWTVNGTTVPPVVRKGTWRISLSSQTPSAIITLIPTTAVSALQKVFIRAGQTYEGSEFWLDNTLLYAKVPQITAPNDYLYYQDSESSSFVGEIKIVNNDGTTIDIDHDITGKIGYTSPNGVIFTNGLKIQFDTFVTPDTYANKEYYVEGVGSSITLVEVDQLTVPESFAVTTETAADYITINRASQDLNAWTRSNRWFHIDVLNYAAALNGETKPDLGPNLPGRRPIIEFEPNLQLFNYGTKAKLPVDIIDFTAGRDAFNDIEGQITYTLGGVTLTTGIRIIFASDFDGTVRNQIWEVTVENIGGSNYIRLSPAAENPVLADENVLIGTTVNSAGVGTSTALTYKFNGSTWSGCQEKTQINQAPLFNLVDANGYSLNDATIYPSSTFAGTKNFGYLQNTNSTLNDKFLGFPLTYQNFNNIGDIVFENYYDTETFTYSASSNTTVTVNCNVGYLNKHSGLDAGTKINNWVSATEPQKQYQVITKFYDGRMILVSGVNRAFVQVDITPKDNKVENLKVYLNNVLLNGTSDYALTYYGIYPVVILATEPTVGDKIDVLIFSDTVSTLGYYNIPQNLDYNPLNENFSTIALGQLRTHYNKLIENTTNSAVAPIPNQDRNLKQQVGTLVQHNSPLIYAMTFLNDPMVNFVNGVNNARKEYTRFKNKFLSLCNTIPTLNYADPVTSVDTILQAINSAKNNSFPWYYSDMVPQGGNYTTIQYPVLKTRQTTYEISSLFDPTTISGRAVLVYHNGVQLMLGRDYEFGVDAPSINILITLAVNDIITIRDYSSTDGCYVPETPTKLGLYPKFQPAKFLDPTYQIPTDVVRGHDGSLTPAFGDFRDDFLLELELRIYNNIKIEYTANAIDIYDVLPGRFRTTDYSLAEFNQLLTKNFLQWAGGNNVDYTSNSYYDANNAWTWNYSGFTDAVDGSPLQGSWRAIYDYWFDTATPNLDPWRMLGIGVQPLWWETRYGPAPYTSGNTTLWEDLQNGYIWNAGSPYTDVRFARPGLLNFIPVDSSGNLLAPTNIKIIRQYSPTTSGNFSVGQEGPVETAWRRSSDYPYALQTTLALARPARYFATELDVSRFFVNPIIGQFANAENQKIAPNHIVVNGDMTSTGEVVRTSGYINWIADSIKTLGIDPVAKINSYLSNLSVQLSYKVGGFTDKRLITVSAEQTSPGSTNASVVIPDENYTVYLGKPIPVATIVYSAVIIEKTPSGYVVTGYNNTDPFFTTIPSLPNNNYSTVVSNNLTAKVYIDSTKKTYMVPYGTTFSTIQQVADFLISYERHLVSQGFVFDQFDGDLQETRNWALSVKEFLFWVQQNWVTGTIIVLNPTAEQLIVKTTGSVVDEITKISGGGRLLDQSFNPIKSNNFDILRIDSAINGNVTKLTTLDTTGISFALLELIQYENVLIFDNVSSFNDIIYVPEQGTRQYRLRVTGSKTGAWTGAYSATGYIYSDPNISAWQTGRDYRLGDIVTFNNGYYTAPNSIAASTEFNVSDWTRISKDALQTGLLPSFGQQADQFTNIYDIDNPPQDENLQLFSAGLIGFRERPYFGNLGISVANQTKFYQGYIKQKGTINSINSLTKASFDNLNGTIDIYEEWAFHVGTYGDVNNNQYREFILDQSVFKTNPAAFTIANTYSNGGTYANLTLANVYTASNLLNTVPTLYDNRIDSVYTNDLPTAGFANTNDVDLQIFDISTVTDLPDVNIGDKIWVAKDTQKDWNIYRIDVTEVTATKLTYTLDSYAQLTFNNPHGLGVGEYFILREFDTHYNGLYQVIETPNLLSVTVVLRDTFYIIKVGSVIESEGLVYKLQSVVINNVDSITSIVPVGGWNSNDVVWLDYATNDGWGVYSFNKPWLANAVTKLSTDSISANSRLGTAVKISTSQEYVYSGSNVGTVFVNAVSTTSGLTSRVITNTAPGFGAAITSQGNLLVVGAPASANVAIYRHNDVSTALTSVIPWVGLIIPWTVQLNVATGTIISDPGGSTYVTIGNVYAATNQVFNDIIANTRPATPADNATISATVPVGSLISYSGTTYLTKANVGYQYFSSVLSAGAVTPFDISVGNVQQLQTITSYNRTGLFGTSIAMSEDQHWLFVGQPGNAIVRTYYTANTAAYLPSYAFVANIAGNVSTSNFGAQIKTNSTGTRLIIGAPLQSTNSYDKNGTVFVYTRSANTFSLAQTITGSVKNNSALFGTSVDIDAEGGNLFIGAPGTTINNFPQGQVERYVHNGVRYIFNETISDPDTEFSMRLLANFGSSISVSPDAQVLAVGGSGSAGDEVTVFDNNATVIDADATKFVDQVQFSGTVFMFESITNQTIPGDLGRYVSTQELAAQLRANDNYGSSVSVTRSAIAVGSPGYDVVDGTGAVVRSNAGAVFVHNNPNQTLTWNLIRQQTPQVDINSINRTLIYDKSDDTILAALDFIDPSKGKVLGVVGRDIDYQRIQDPAFYNAGSGSVNPTFHWGPSEVGKIWWDVSAVRYINYEQDSLLYRLTQWGETFPGSEILVYEWVESTVPPSQYVELVNDGTPRNTDDSAYSTYGYVDEAGNVKVKYYFWVANKTTIGLPSKKTNSVYNIAAAIQNPKAQGITYAAVLRNDAIALYNVNNLLTGQNSVLHIGSRSTDAKLIHSEYVLVQEGNPLSQIPANIRSKLIDSLAGLDGIGNVVPDPTLTPAQSYGISDRPRQSMFVNRQLAISNYITLANTFLQAYQVVGRKVLTRLNSSEAVPLTTSGEYDASVATYEDLSYLNTTSFATGYQVLVDADSTQSGKWSIYSWNTPNVGVWNLIRLQNYKTNAQLDGVGIYWYYIDWNEVGYDPTNTPDVTVADNIDLGKLSLVNGQYIKVLNNGNNQYVVYLVNADLSLTPVNVQNGTIQISANTIPALELRQIAIALQNDILIEDLADKYNELFFAMVKYALSEQKNLDWVFKTSFLTAKQNIRKLEQFPTYISDNQNYYLDYINEVKPYRTALREFIINYQGDDQYFGDTTDFDLPAYWDTNLLRYRSPDGSQSTDNTLLNSGVYTQWTNNYRYRVVDIIVTDPGTGYFIPPRVFVDGGGGSGANVYATIDANGGISSITIVDPGAGYITRPTVQFLGTGTGARGYAVLRNIYDNNNTGHNVIRNIGTTIKFDRISYQPSNSFVIWDTVTSSNIGQVILANDIIISSGTLFKVDIPEWSESAYQPVGSLFFYNSNTYIVTGETLVFGNTEISSVAVNTLNSHAYTVTGNIVSNSADFPIYNVSQTTAATFNNAIDRLSALSEISDFSLEQTGIVYPGVFVDGNTYIGEEFDTFISSQYSDTLGIDPAEIDLEGGKYVDSFTSHAPEELVPGRLFESFNLIVKQPFDALAWRQFDDMQYNSNFYRIAAANIAILTGNLTLSDSSILVDNAFTLPSPNPSLGIPGVVFINGEKITYYRNYATEVKTSWTGNLLVDVGTLISYSSNTYITTGNVFDANGTFANVSSRMEQVSNNTLSQIRRAVDGTAPSEVHEVGSQVIDSSLQQKIPGTGFGSITVPTSTEFQTTDIGAVSYGLVLTNPVSANIGDTVTQLVTVPNWGPNTVTQSTLIYNNGNSYTVTGNTYSAYFEDTTIPAPVWTANTYQNFGAIAWIANSTSVSSGYVVYSGNTYTVTGNVYGANFTNGNVAANVTLAWRETSTRFVYNDGITYSVRGNIYAPYFANIAVQQPTWTANTAQDLGAYTYYQGNTYVVRGNVYSTYFANINVTPWLENQSNPWGATPWTANVDYQLGSYITNNGNTYVVRGNVLNSGGSFANISSNVGLASVYYAGSTYTAVGNVYSPYFANITVKQPTWLANTAMTPVPDWAANTATTNGYIYYSGNTYTVTGNVYAPYFANVLTAGNATLAFGGNVTNFIWYNGNTYSVTGNIYAPNFGNIISTASGTNSNPTWTASTVFPSTAFVYYAPNNTTYRVLGNLYGATFDSVVANAAVTVAFVGNAAAQFAYAGNVAARLAYTGGANVRLAFTGNSQVQFAYNGTTAAAIAFEGQTYTTATFRMLESVTNVNTLAVIITAGSVRNLPEVFDSPSGFDVQSFDNVGQEIYVQGTQVSSFIKTAYRLGLTNPVGRITIPGGTTLITGNIWYNPGASIPTNGLSLIQSTTEQATFLKASPGPVV